MDHKEMDCMEYTFQRRSVELVLALQNIRFDFILYVKI
jgi:hypothetical protein